MPSGDTTPIYPPVPPPPPDGSAGPAPRRRGSGWKVATAAAVLLGLAASGTVYLVMDRRVDDLQSRLDAAEEDLAKAQSGDGGGSGLDDLSDLLGEGGLGDLGELLGEGGLDGLTDSLGLGEIDPILFQCLGSGLGGDGDAIPDGDVQTQVAAIQQIVEDERGLSAGGDVDIEFVSLDEVQRRAVEITSGELDAERAAADSRLLAALGAVQPGTDLVEAQLDALDAGVGGFYNPETHELVIGSERMDGLGVFVTAHELVHAAADSTIGLPDQEAIADESGGDAAYAALSAIEGDASLYSQQFIGEHLPLAELLALQAASAETSAGLDALPHFVSRQLEFPYLEGMTFTCGVFLDSGWDAVDDTYTKPPATTAQILFPDRYVAGEKAVDVRDPAGPGGWDELRSDTFGAADLMFLLEAPGDDEDAALPDVKDRVAAWAGGEATAWARGDDTAAALILADRGDATPLCETVTDYYAAAFPDAEPSGGSGDSDGNSSTTFTGPEQTAVVSCTGAEVALGTGPDERTARAAIS